MIGKTNGKLILDYDIDPKMDLVTWADGTDAAIVSMLQRHYGGELVISDYWAVGDCRVVSIGEIPKGTTGEIQAAQEITLVIIGMDHDTLSDGSGKAAITVQTKGVLETIGYMNTGYATSTYSLWSGSQRRTWCNEEFLSALPEYLQGLIKSVTKVCNRHAYSTDYRKQETVEDKVTFLSEFEVFGTAPYNGTNYGDVGEDGVQYEYMATESNRIKDGVVVGWWLRSSYVGSSGASQFLYVKTDGTSGFANTSQSRNIAPIFCL